MPGDQADLVAAIVAPAIVAGGGGQLYMLRVCPFCSGADLQLVGKQHHFAVVCWGCGGGGPVELTAARAVAGWEHRPGDGT